jgi:hypothetical protein
MTISEHKQKLYKKNRIRFLKRRLKQQNKHLRIAQGKIDKYQKELAELEE